MSAPNYFSFLVCSHPDRSDFYLNGRPIGIMSPEGKFTPHKLSIPNHEPVEVDIGSIAGQPMKGMGELIEWLIGVVNGLNAHQLDREKTGERVEEIDL